MCMVNEISFDKSRYNKVNKLFSIDKSYVTSKKANTVRAVGLHAWSKNEIEERKFVFWYLILTVIVFFFVKIKIYTSWKCIQKYWIWHYQDKHVHVAYQKILRGNFSIAVGRLIFLLVKKNMCATWKYFQKWMLFFGLF